MALTLTISTSGVGLTGASGGVLGASQIGSPLAQTTTTWPQQSILAPLLGCCEPSIEERWQLDADCQSGEYQGIVYRRAEHLMFGVITLDEATFSQAPVPLQAATETAYRRIFDLMKREGLSHLWRVWNYLAEINRHTGGLERYRQFNIGRQEAFLACRRGASGNVPAACAIGLAEGPLSIAFMAGDQPAVPIENPRQISAYDYPADYGPRSPTFSRAALTYLPGQEILFISGTASIVGHQTVHPGDVAAQCEESLANIAAVLAEANGLTRAQAYAMQNLTYRVYVRQACDFPVIRQVLVARLGALADVIYLQADICRADLLVEIEATATQSLGQSA